MITKMEQDFTMDCNAVILPFVEGSGVQCSMPDNLLKAVETGIREREFTGAPGQLESLQMCMGDRLLQIVLVGLGEVGKADGRSCFLSLARAFRSCQDLGQRKVCLLLDNGKPLTWQREVSGKACQLPYLVGYRFEAYKTTPQKTGMEEVSFVTELEGFEAVVREGRICGESTAVARDLINHPSMYMTPSQLCLEANRIGRECGIEVKIYKKAQLEAMGMGSFLAVARGAVDKPRMIVMRYTGKTSEEAPVALVGKGIMFDSGGYDLKTKMLTMHADMGGAAAVIGAIRAAALAKLPINVVAVVCACKNMISGEAYVAGDVLTSMNGKTIEMVNADAEGRLTLADAITYAVRREGARAVIDIATLTGAAKGAVGCKTAPVVSNSDELFAKVWDASLMSCEKVWRLNADEELMEALKSSVTDIKNTDPGSPMGGGSIVAGLFIREFVEDRPWVHIDMAPVNWLDQPQPYSGKGGSGYGVSLLFETLKGM